MDVKDVKPSFTSVARTEAVFQDSVITYNEPGYTYNEVGGVYGGADNVQQIGPNIQLAWNPVPQMDVVRTPTTNPTPVTRTLYRGMPMAPGFFLYITYREDIVVTI